MPSSKFFAYLLEILSYLPLLILRLFPPPLSKWSDPDQKGRPILFVHGYLHSSWVWIFFRKMVSRAGFGPLYFIDLSPPFAPLQHYVEQIAEMAEEIRKEEGRLDLTLVGHSMGGIAASLYALRFAPKGSISQVITLASPFHGTPVAKWGFGEGAFQLRPDSPLLQELREELASSSIPFFHLAAGADPIVIPGASALLNRSPSRELLLPQLGHVSLLFSPKAASQVIRWLSL